jgi:hypothetical protein
MEQQLNMNTIVDASSNITTSGALSKDELIQVVKDWIKLDNELTKLKAEVKIRNDKRKKITEKIVNHMRYNTIDGISIQNGSLVYKQRKSKKPITAKYLLTQLEKFYSDKPEVAKDLTKHLLDNREQVVKEEIIRKMNKVDELVKTL